MKIVPEINTTLRKQLLKYGVSAVVSYILIFVSIYIFVDVLKWNASISFATVYAIAYVVMFYVYIQKIFMIEYDKGTVFRYILHLVTFYFFNNLLFNLIYGYLGTNYFVAVLLNISILFPLRFISSKKLVFKG